MLHQHGSISKWRDNKIKATVNTKSHKTTEYFLSGPNYESDKKKSAESTWQIHKDFDDVFHSIGCFEGTFFLQLKPDRAPYQSLPRSMAYTLQKPFQEEPVRLQKQDIIALLQVNETSQWCNSFVLVPRANDKVILHLDLACLNQALIRPVHNGLTINDILPKLNNAKYLSLRCRFLILLVESWRIVVISGTVHWFDLTTSFHPLLWTSSGLKGTWKLSTYMV